MASFKPEELFMLILITSFFGALFAYMIFDWLPNLIYALQDHKAKKERNERMRDYLNELQTDLDDFSPESVTITVSRKSLEMLIQDHKRLLAERSKERDKRSNY